jgi:hypothetical protein
MFQVGICGKARYGWRLHCVQSVQDGGLRQLPARLELSAIAMRIAAGYVSGEGLSPPWCRFERRRRPEMSNPQRNRSSFESVPVYSGPSRI